MRCPGWCITEDLHHNHHRAEMGRVGEVPVELRRIDRTDGVSSPAEIVILGVGEGFNADQVRQLPSVLLRAADRLSGAWTG